MYKLFRFTAVPCDPASPVKPANLIISANTKTEAIDNFLHGHPGHTYSSVKELVELSQKMIEGALDDDLDNMYEPYNCLATDAEIPASEIIKKFYPERYFNTYIPAFCQRNNIIADHQSDGTWRYFELPED